MPDMTLIDAADISRKAHNICDKYSCVGCPFDRDNHTCKINNLIKPHEFFDLLIVASDAKDIMEKWEETNG